VASGRGIYEVSIPECVWDDRDKQRKPSVAVVAVPTRLRSGHITKAHHKRHGLIQFTRFLAPDEIDVPLRRSQQLFVPLS
jgi:hypothetical protein